jgi:D-amino-acid dehydrogenase
MSGGGGRVVVVGGGVIGLACAHYLARSGWAVTVIDQGTIGGGCSHGNCGFVCPSHVLPLAGPGALRDTLKTLLKRDSPLKVRLRFDPRLWGWFYRFARRCNTADMLEAGHAIQALLNSSWSLYDELFRAEPLDAEWEARGLLFVFRTPAGMEHYAATDRLMRETFGVAATRYDGAALTELEPALKPGLAGGWRYDTDGHLRPDKLLASWRQLLEAHGVTFRENCALRDLVTTGRRAEAVETSQGKLPADAVVIAAGAWTPLLERLIGCRVPIQPGKGYSITMPRPAACPSVPLLFEEDRVAVTPFRSGYRLGSTMEFAGYDATLNRRRLDLLRAGAGHYLVEPVAEPVREEWWGWRPMVYDGKPVIDRSPARDNVLVAAGHGMLGLSMAPATGKLVAELLDGATPHLDPAPYSFARFR